MANPNLVRKPAYDALSTGEVSPTDIINTTPYDQNYIINGGMDFWQRAVSQSVTSEVNGPADRWSQGRTTGSGVFTASRVTDVPSNGRSVYSLNCTVTTAATPATTDRYGIFQKIEGNIAQAIYNEKVTLSFWVKSSIVGTYSIWFGTGAANNGYYVTSYTVNLANTWEQKSITVDMSAKTGTWSTDITIGMYVYFALATGPTFNISTPNVWTTSSAAGLSVPSQVNFMGTIGNSFSITQVMLNRGTTAAPFARFGRNYVGEFTACQRYFQTLRHVPATPQTASLVAAGCPLPVPMRATPTVGQTGVLNLQGTNAYNASQTAPGLGNYNGTNDSFYMINIPNFSGLPAQGHALFLSVPSNNSNYITLDAEL